MDRERMKKAIIAWHDDRIDRYGGCAAREEGLLCCCDEPTQKPNPLYQGGLDELLDVIEKALQN